MLTKSRGVRAAAKEAMQRMNYDPIEALIARAQDAATSLDVKTRIAEVLLPYMYPKLSAVTMEGEISIGTGAEEQASLMRMILDNPELADAAQKLSLAAASAALESDMAGETIQ